MQRKSKKFDPGRKERLRNPDRRRLIPAETILISAGIKEGAAVADIGPGLGYFTFPLSAAVKDTGIVYAIDISVEMLDELAFDISERGIKNIRMIRSTEFDFRIDSDSVDTVFMSLVFHETDHTGKFLAETYRVLKAGGTLFIVEWDKTEGTHGPPLWHRIAKEDISVLIENAGFRDVEVNPINPQIYTVKARKDNT